VKKLRLQMRMRCVSVTRTADDREFVVLTPVATANPFEPNAKWSQSCAPNALLTIEITRREMQGLFEPKGEYLIEFSATGYPFSAASLTRSPAQAGLPAMGCDAARRKKPQRRLAANRRDARIPINGKARR